MGFEEEKKMKLAKIKWEKSDDKKTNILVVKPTLLARLLGRSIPIFENTIYNQHNKKD